jgi:TatD DNase family protein
VELLKEIEGAGYFITINPSVTFQEKHKRVLEKAPLEILLTESDGGYVYRGRLLEPPMVRESLESIAKVKGISLEDAEKAVERNFKRAFNI